jgi:E3 ubiquitin-protein ligase DOA10
MKSPIIKIAKALQSNKRIVMVQLIQELSGEEFENLEDVWSLAEETKQQLRNRLYMLVDMLVDYYETEQKEENN